MPYMVWATNEQEIRSASMDQPNGGSSGKVNQSAWRSRHFQEKPKCGDQSEFEVCALAWPLCAQRERKTTQAAKYSLHQFRKRRHIGPISTLGSILLEDTVSDQTKEMDTNLKPLLPYSMWSQVYKLRVDRQPGREAGWFVAWSSPAKLQFMMSEMHENASKSWSEHRRCLQFLF